MRYCVALTLLPFLLSPSFVVQAQNLSATGIITGIVIDSSNAPVPDAEITARNEDTLATRNAKSDQEGRFYVSALPIGTYTLRVMKAGFAGIVVSRFLLSVGEVSVHQIQLRVASVQEELSVAEKPKAVDAAAASSSVALGYDRIEEAPASNRNYLNFALLAPGIAASSGSNAQLSTTAVRNPLVDSGFTFGGMRGRNNSITIDGLDNRDETTGANRVAIGFEMVQEFRVSSTSVGAEAGGSAGGGGQHGDAIGYKCLARRCYLFRTK
jgi:Carboxypeptidase regulatory-like domain